MRAHIWRLPTIFLNISYLIFIVSEISMDWSDHALWWPEQNTWLTRTRLTLDQCGVHADALLHFTPMHKNLRVQLPDLRWVTVLILYLLYFNFRLDYCVYRKFINTLQFITVLNFKYISSPRVKKCQRCALNITFLTRIESLILRIFGIHYVAINFQKWNTSYEKIL